MSLEALSAATGEVDAELQLALLPEPVRNTHEQVVSDLLAKATHSTQAETIVDVLGDSQLGKALNIIQRHTLARYLYTRRFSEGEDLAQRGSPADSTMLLLEGSVQVVLDDQKLAVLGPGEVFGESMFSEDATRSADVRALAEGSAAVLTLEAYEAMLAEDNELGLRCRDFFEALHARHREKRGQFVYQDPTRYVALIAHNEMKSALVDFVRAHKARLQKYCLIATGTTGTLLHRETGMTLSRKVKSGPLGGDQAVGSLVSTGNILAVIFFRDPLAAHPHHADIEALGRLCDVYQIPFATNGSTAEAVLDYLEGGAACREVANPALEKYRSVQDAVLRKDG
jgi:methylglyoxal synthase